VTVAFIDAKKANYPEQRTTSRSALRLRSELDDERYDQAFERGSQLSPNQVAALALTALDRAINDSFKHDRLRDEL